MKKLLVLLISGLMLTSISNAQKDDNPNLQREPYGTFDFQKNYTGNIDFYATNYGFNFCDIPNARGGLFWPRGTQNQYIFSSGFWFGAKKRNPANLSEYNKLVLISYNPNTGRGWFVPGRIEDGDTLREDLTNKYRTYFGSDFIKESGVPFKTEDGPNWPLWIANGELKYEGGTYKNEYILYEADRNREYRPNGPLFVSDEDIVSTFKDTDMKYYEGGVSKRTEQGYPLKIQTTSSIYTWGSGELEDIMIINYLLENKSSDTLIDCWFGSINDIDIGIYDQQQQMINDRQRYFDKDSTAQLAVGWTNTDKGELGMGFGYIGFSLLETPAVDINGNIRTDKLIYLQNEQLGLRTCSNWSIEVDPKEDDDRYNYISRGIKEGDTGPSDKRSLLSTGPFNMLPNSKARIAVLIAFAMPAKGDEADGSDEDMGWLPGKVKNGDLPELQSVPNSLIDKILSTRKRYYDNMILTVRNNEPSNYNTLVYPNPTDNILTYEYSLEQSQKIRISLIDEMGKEIGEVFSGVKQEGNYHHFIDLGQYHLSNGVYFIKLQSSNDISIKKFVVMK